MFFRVQRFNLTCVVTDSAEAYTEFVKPRGEDGRAADRVPAGEGRPSETSINIYGSCGRFDCGRVQKMGTEGGRTVYTLDGGHGTW